MLHTPAPLLEINNLHIHFQLGQQVVPAVQGVSFSISAGETLALVGESGSGKSATALAILRLLPASAIYSKGEILFEGVNTLTLPLPHLRRLRTGHIGIVFQEPMTSLNPLHTIEKQIGEALTLHRNLQGKAKKQRILELLDLAGFSCGQNRLQAYPHQLSGGQRQRVMIAMALACQPVLLIADEPTTALDVTLQAELLTRLKMIQQETGMALLLITHNMGIVHHMADRTAVMHAGKIVEMGKTSTILSTPTHRYTKNLLSCEPSGVPERQRKENASLLLTASEICVRFASSQWGGVGQKNATLAVQNVSFSLQKGETLGIVGESGSGKTSLGLAVLRLIPSTGDIFFHDQNLTKLNEKILRPLRRKIQFIFQDPFGSLNPRLSVGESIAEGLNVHEKHLLERQKDEKVAQALIDVGLDPHHAYRFPHEFSGGQRQRIAIARALILNPELIILDEPTSALDLTIQLEILNLLKNLQKKMGISYLFISHDLKVVQTLSHRVMVMEKGKVVEQGETHAIFHNPQHAYTQKLMAAAVKFRIDQ